MKVQNVILLGAAGYLVLRAIGLKRVSDEITFAPAALGVKRDGKKIVVNFGLDITNPAPSFATVNRTYGDIQDANGNTLGRFAVPRYEIAASGTTRINIPISIEAFGAVSAIITSICIKGTTKSICLKKASNSSLSIAVPLYLIPVFFSNNSFSFKCLLTPQEFSNTKQSNKLKPAQLVLQKRFKKN